MKICYIAPIKTAGTVSLFSTQLGLFVNQLLDMGLSVLCCVAVLNIVIALIKAFKDKNYLGLKKNLVCNGLAILVIAMIPKFLSFMDVVVTSAMSYMK